MVFTWTLGLHVETVILEIKNSVPGDDCISLGRVWRQQQSTRHVATRGHAWQGDGFHAHRVLAHKGLRFAQLSPMGCPLVANLLPIACPMTPHNGASGATRHPRRSHQWLTTAASHTFPCPSFFATFRQFCCWKSIFYQAKREETGWRPMHFCVALRFLGKRRCKLMRVSLCIFNSDRRLESCVRKIDFIGYCYSEETGHKRLGLLCPWRLPGHFAAQRPPGWLTK